MGCPRGTTLAAALLYLAYYLRCCVKDLAVRSPAVGALAANRMPAYLYRSNNDTCLLYTSPSPRDATLSRMPSSA